MAYANATAARDKGKQDGKLIALAMADNIKLYKGGFVGIDSSGYANYTPVASTMFCGVAYESVDNTLTGHTAGGKTIRVETEGVFSFAIASGGAQSLVGTEVYWDDGASGNPMTVTASDPGLGAKVGRVVGFVSATEVLVRINGYAMVQSNQAS